MARLVDLLRQPSRIAQRRPNEAVAKEYRTFCTFPAARVLATDEDLEETPSKT